MAVYVLCIQFGFLHGRIKRGLASIHEKMLEDVECGKSMENLREDMQMSFDEWQLKKILYNQTIKFPPLTIKYFRHIDASGWIRYTEVQSRILNIDNGFDTVQIRERNDHKIYQS